MTQELIDKRMVEEVERWLEEGKDMILSQKFTSQYRENRFPVSAGMLEHFKVMMLIMMC